MAAIDDLIAQIEDKTLRAHVQTEINQIAKGKKFRLVFGWLRNVDRKPWSLEIPYEEAGSVKQMFPDVLIVRQVADSFRFDILEPHDPSLKDNTAKAVGLARFAEKHWTLFDRIQLIRKQKGADGVERYFRLDVGNDVVRKKVLAVTSKPATASLTRCSPIKPKFERFKNSE